MNDNAAKRGRAARIAELIAALFVLLALLAPLGPATAAIRDLVGTPSDYADTNNWLAVPTERQHAVDLLYFYPTAYSPSGENTPLYCEIENASMRAGAPDAFAKQATAFETCADIYAPFYRQCDAMALAGLTQPEMIAVESDVPRTDVFAALDYYFERWNDGRPFILAGHSQGAMMITLILQEYMAAHPERYARMIAAYMIGNTPTANWLAQYPHVKLAAGAGDTGVVVSWNTEGPGNVGAYNMVVPEGAECINPLNWRTDGTPAGISENLGSLVKNASGDYVVVAGFADARIEAGRGSVICSTVKPAEYAIPAAMSALFGPESYHGWDYGFYYMNIRKNAELRTENFLASINADSSSGCSVGAGLAALGLAVAGLLISGRESER